MRQFSGINPTFQNDLSNEGLLVFLKMKKKDTDLKIGDFNRDYFDDNSLKDTTIFKTYTNRPTNITPGGTVLYDEFPSTEIDYGNPRNDPRVVPEEMGLVGDRGIMSVARSDIAPQFQI